MSGKAWIRIAEEEAFVMCVDEYVSRGWDYHDAYMQCVRELGYDPYL